MALLSLFLLTIVAYVQSRLVCTAELKGVVSLKVLRLEGIECIFLICNLQIIPFSFQEPRIKVSIIASAALSILG